MSGTHRHLRNVARFGAAAALAVVLVGCGSSGSSTSDSAGSDPSAPLRGSAPGEPCKSAAAPSAPDAPTVDMPKVAPDRLVSTDLKVGTGAEAAVGDNISVQYVGIACSSGTQFDSSFDRGQPISFDLLQGKLIQGWVDGIPGMKVGGSRQLVIPPTLAYGDTPPSNAIRPGETLVFVVELVAVAPGAGASATTVTGTRGSGPGEPCKSAAAPSAPDAPTVDMPEVAPDKLVSTDLKVGTGAEAAVGDNISVKYVGIACSSGAQFDSSFDRGQPISFDLLQGKLIQGWVDGIPGMKVGGSRQLVIPPALAYGDTPPSAEIAPGETLVFVVELVAAAPAAGTPAG